MLALPSSLAVDRDTDDEAKLLGSAKAWLEREIRPDGLHATDLLDPLFTYWRLTKPLPLGNREVPIFLIGKVLHAFVLGALDGTVDLNVTDEGARYSEDLGVWYSPDWDKGEVAEFKSSRVFKDPKTLDDLGIYVEQVLIYMVAKKVTRAKLWVLLLNLRDPATRRTSPEFRAYTLTVSQEDLDELSRTLVTTRESIVSAVQSGDPSALPLCREWKCGDACPYWNDCRPAGRYDSAEWRERTRRAALLEAPEVSGSPESPREAVPARHRGRRPRRNTNVPRVSGGSSV